MMKCSTRQVMRPPRAWPQRRGVSIWPGEPRWPCGWAIAFLWTSIYSRPRKRSARRAAGRKFPLHADFPLQAARALLYFEDAEKEPMPRMLGATTWEDMKSYFERAIPKYVKAHLKG